jgi:hypothetical protein
MILVMLLLSACAAQQSSHEAASFATAGFAAAPIDHPYFEESTFVGQEPVFGQDTAETVVVAKPAFSPERGAPARKPEILADQGLVVSASYPRPRMKPVILAARKSLQCVPYARQVSSISIRGNAWTWWKAAKGRYQRGRMPREGAVLVMDRSKRLQYGHLAVVAEVLNPREVLVHQANWLNRGRIHRYTPVRDVSPDNDWSSVRVWYTPGHEYGKRVYDVSGFIYPDTLEASR